MIRLLLIVILVLITACAGAVLAAVIQGKRVKKAKEEAERLHGAVGEITEKAGRLQKALDRTAEAEEDADAKRKDLGRTPDHDLVDRANRLFMQNGGGGGPPGNAGPAGASGS
jgi:Na+-translocating ferredoxin:NAD+ oxidoreductase RnfG subunit